MKNSIWFAELQTPTEAPPSERSGAKPPARSWDRHAAPDEWQESVRALHRPGRTAAPARPAKREIGQPGLRIRCRGCERLLGREALVCTSCGRLVYAGTVREMCQKAHRLEASGKWTKALKLWSRALELLPTASTQSTLIRDHIAGMAPDSD